MRWTRRHTMVLLFILAGHALILSSLVTGWLNPLYHDARYSVGQGADFFSIYQAGIRFREGINIYEWQYDDSTPYAYPYRYVPAFIPVAVAFTTLPAWPAYWTWVVFLEGLLALNVYGTWRLTRDPRIRLVATALWLLPSPYYLELFMGQFSFVMATLIFWAGYGLARRGAAFSGAAWTASLFVKSNTLLLAPMLWRLGWWRLVLVAGTALVVLNAPYFLTVDRAWEMFRETNVNSFNRVTMWDSHTGNLGFQAFLRHVTFFGERDLGLGWKWAEDRIPFYWAFLVGGVIAAAAWFQRGRDPLLGLTVAVTGYFLIFRDVWEHQYVMLTPVCVLLYVLRPRLRPWALACGIVTALPTPFVLLEQAYGSYPGGPPPEYQWPLAILIAYHGVKIVPVLALFGRAAWELVPVRIPHRRRAATMVGAGTPD